MYNILPMYDYSIVMMANQESLQDYIDTLKLKEVVRDECRATDYGLEKTARENGYKFKRVKFIVTYYYADNTPLQGGYLDKYGKELLSYNIPICASPNDIPYGSVVVFDHPINGSKEYKSVDTGGAIRWVDGETCRIDIFVPNARCIEDITTRYENKIVEGKIYYKN